MKNFILLNNFSLVSALLILISLILSFLFLFLKIKKEITDLKKDLDRSIKLSIEPKFIEFSQEIEDIASLAIEIWRIKNKINKFSLDLPDNKKRGLDSSIEKLINYLNQHDIEIIDYTGIKYNDGLNLDILDVKDGTNTENTLITETIEPAIIYKGNLIKKAKIIL